MDPVDRPLQALPYIQRIRKSLIFHIDEAKCLPGGLLRLRDHTGDPIPHKAHMLIKYSFRFDELLSELTLIAVVLLFRRVKAMRDIHDTGIVQGPAAVQSFHDPVRNLGKEHGPIQHPLLLHVPRIDSSSGGFLLCVVDRIAFPYISHLFSFCQNDSETDRLRNCFQYNSEIGICQF